MLSMSKYFFRVMPAAKRNFTWAGWSTPIGPWPGDISDRFEMKQKICIQSI